MYEIEFIDYMAYPGSEFHHQFKKYKADNKKSALLDFYTEYMKSQVTVKSVKKLC
jgi:hypothetical protein